MKLSRRRTTRRRQARSLLVALCALPGGCAAGFDFSGYQPGPPAPAALADASDAAMESAAPPPAANVRLFGTYRAWSDGTYAPSCNGYLHPPPETHVYEGATGSGIYAVKAARGAVPILVFCEMTASGEGWTLIASTSATERSGVTAIQQTVDCVTPDAYCNVAAEPWDYEMLRHTWSACPGAEARITRAAYQDDTGACSNQIDSLLLTYDVPRFVGMKSWADCTYACLGQRWFAGQTPQTGFPSLVTDAKLVTTVSETLTKIPSNAKCMGEAYYCASGGYDAIWLR